MINVSSEFKRLLYSGEGNFVVDATITLSNNTVLNVSNSRIMSNGLEIDDAVGDDNDFNCIGSTIVNGCELILYNNDEIYSNYDFINAKVSIVVKLMTSNGYEPVQKGTYTVDAATFSDVSVTLTLLDNMCQFDRPYDSYGIYNANTTIYDVVLDACTKCGVTPAPSMTNMPNKTFVVAGKPKDNTTYREVIGWCAAIAGCFASCTPDGKLEFAWFDVGKFDLDEGTDGGVFDSHTPYYSTGDTLNGGTFNPWNDPTNTDGGLFTDRSGIHHISALMSQNIGVDDVVITAVQIAYDVETDNKVETKYYPATIANDKYVISINSIPFINADNVESFYNTLSAKLIGLSFRTCNVTQTHDPTIEAGDIAWLWDTKGEKHRVLITRTTFAVAGLQTIVCGAKTPARNSATQMTALAKAEARSNRRLNEEKSIRQQLAEDFNQKIANSSGLYLSEIIDSSTGARIIYGHDKPQLAESTMVLKLNNSAIAMTANYSGDDATTTWYGFQFDGTWLANIISTVNLFFDYAHGGTLTLGGANNTNGILQVKNASGENVVVADNNGLEASGNITMKSSNYLGNIGSTYYCRHSVVTGANDWLSELGFSVRRLSGEAEVRPGDNIVSQYSVFTRDTSVLEQLFTPATWRKELVIGTRNSSQFYRLEVSKDGSLCFCDVAGYTWGNATLQIGVAPSWSEIQTSQGIFMSSGERHSEIIVTDNNIHIGKGGFSFWAFDNGNDGAGIRGDNYAFSINSSGGSINRNTIAYVSSSSIRYKHDIKPIEDEDLNPHKLLNLPIVQFEWNSDHPLQYADMKGKTIPGIIAEDVEQIYPSATIHNEDGKVESWDERRIIPGMLALIQEQNKKIQELENKLAKLEQMILNLM